MGVKSSFATSWGFIKRRNLVGMRRARTSMPKIIQMTLCAVLAYWIAERLLGHEGPIFAATSALIALGFGGQTTVRRTMEVAIGCTLGVTVGDLLLTLLGTGLWQAATVLFLSLTIARYLDSGPIFSTQLGLQSLLVVLLPISEAGPFGRSLDALVGSACALLILMILPRDPRRTPMADLGKLLRDYDRVVVPEMNLGQLSLLVRAKYLVDAVGYNQVYGLPLKAAELAEAITELIEEI